MSTLKILIASALLAIAIVAGYGITQSQAMIPTTGKLFQDRLVPEGGATVPPTPILISAEPMVSTHAKMAAEPSAQILPASTRAAGTTAPRGDRIRLANADCTREAWPRISAECMQVDGDASPRKAVRTITVETRKVPATSVLSRMPATEMARR